MLSKPFFISAPLLCIGALLFSEASNNDTLKCTFSSGANWQFPKDQTTRNKLLSFEENSTLSMGDSLHTKDQSLCEIVNLSLQMRIGSNSVLEVNDDIISITRGSMLLSLKSPKPIIIKTENSSLSTKGRYTAIIDCTGNGGFKFIPLEGKGFINPEKGKAKEIYRGRLTMVLGSPSQLGNAYDIDLLLLLKSSRLINSFPTPLPSMKRISLSIYAQQLMIKGKYNALIGDAPSDDNLQMWAFGEDEAKK